MIGIWRFARYGGWQVRSGGGIASTGPVWLAQNIVPDPMENKYRDVPVSILRDENTSLESWFDTVGFFLVL